MTKQELQDKIDKINIDIAYAEDTAEWNSLCQIRATYLDELDELEWLENE